MQKVRELTKKGESLRQVKGKPKVYDMKVISGFQHVFSAMAPRLIAM